MPVALLPSPPGTRHKRQGEDLAWDTNMGGGVVPAAVGKVVLSNDPAGKRKRVLDTTISDEQLELQRE